MYTTPIRLEKKFVGDKEIRITFWWNGFEPGSLMTHGVS